MPEKKESVEEKLKREGWTKMFDTKEPRLSECVELYESLGFEVHLEPLRPDEIDEECKACFEGDVEGFKTIYTRAKNKKLDKGQGTI